MLLSATYTGHVLKFVILLNQFSGPILKPVVPLKIESLRLEFSRTVKQMSFTV